MALRDDTTTDANGPIFHQIDLSLNISFAPGFAGDKVAYLASQSQIDGTGPWMDAGAWRVPGAPALYFAVSTNSAAPRM